MKVAAAKAIADFIEEDELGREKILPMAFEAGIAETVAKAVKEAAIKTGVNRI